MTSYQQPSYQPPSTAEPDVTLPSTQGESQNDASMKDKAAEAVDQGRQAAGQVAQTATGHVQEVKDEAVKQARDLVGEARKHVSDQVGDQHQNLVTNLRSLSSELGSMVDRSEQSGTATELVSQARGRVDDVANWLDGRQPGDLLGELKSFARRRPGTFLLGALAAGVVAGRLTRGAVAAHSDETSGSTAAGNGLATSGTGYDPTASYEPTPAYEPASSYESGGGYARTTGAAGYEQGNGSTAGYSTGGSYAEPGDGDVPGPEQGYGSTATYGDAGTSPYQAPDYPGGTQR